MNYILAYKPYSLASYFKTSADNTFTPGQTYRLQGQIPGHISTRSPAILHLLINYRRWWWTIIAQMQIHIFLPSLHDPCPTKAMLDCGWHQQKGHIRKNKNSTVTKQVMKTFNQNVEIVHVLIIYVWAQLSWYGLSTPLPSFSRKKITGTKRTVISLTSSGRKTRYNWKLIHYQTTEEPVQQIL